jgi:transcriptional regulator with XRE-family HTH domain
MTPEKEPIIDAVVQIDGATIKKVREQSALTQLYVAKMVGVTTDTISRWENNRYPTIKRPNAEKLAEALEVPLEQIMRQDTAEEVVHQGKPWFVSRWLWAGFVTLFLIAGLTLWLWPQPVVLAERVLPSYVAPGMTFPVQLRFSGSPIRGVVREQIPPGWTFVSSTPEPDSVDVDQGLIRWIVQLGAEPMAIYYLVRVAPDAALKTMTRFKGELVAHTSSERTRIELIGADQLVIQHIHWADLNADGVIDDDEMLDASYLSENMAGFSFDLDSIEQLWIEDHYYWDEDSQGFKPGYAPQTDSAATARP